MPRMSSIKVFVSFTALFSVTGLIADNDRHGDDIKLDDDELQPRSKVDEVLHMLQAATDELHAMQGRSDDIHLLQTATQTSTSVCLLEGGIDWDVCNSRVYSNLGGLGGNNPPGTNLDVQELRFTKIARLSDGSFTDLVITNLTEYRANPENPWQAKKEGEKIMGAQWMNGRNGCLGRLNIETPSEVVLRFRMVWSGTDDLVGGSHKFDFSLFDFDMSKQGSMEQIEVEGIDSWAGLMTPDVSRSTYIFNTTHVQVPNPDDPYNLTDRQLEASVAFVYSRSEWDITLRSINTDDKNAVGGRNIMFAGRSAVSCGKMGDGTCVVYQDPHIDGFDNPNMGPWGPSARVAAFDSNSRQKVSLLSHALTKSQAESKQRLWRHERVGPPTMDVNAYEKGDFWLVKNSLVHIQGRYDDSADYGQGHSGLMGLAVSGPLLGAAKLLVEPEHVGKEEGKVEVFGERLSPEQVYVENTKHGKVRVKTYHNAYVEGGVVASGVDIDLPSSISLQIRRYRAHLDAKITMPHAAGRKTDGQCGNFNGDPYDDSLDKINKRMINTSVSEEELLFHTPFPMKFR